MSGWIKVHRKMQEWEWYTNSNMVHLFIHFLINANRNDCEWKGMTIKRGQIVIGRAALSAQTGISEQTIRTCINRLKSTSEVTIKTTNKFSIITICNYETYQPTTEDSNQHINQHSNQQLTNNQPTTNHNTRSIRIKRNKEENEYENNRGEEIKTADMFRDAFETFRKNYDGSKRGLDTEFSVLRKHKDWREIVPKLLPALEESRRWRAEARKHAVFVPSWPSLQVWLNQRRWEEEFSYNFERQNLNFQQRGLETRKHQSDFN